MNEPSRWTNLHWQTLLILNRLRNEKQLREEQVVAGQEGPQDHAGSDEDRIRENRRSQFTVGR
jgi:hypothetical protein